MPQCGSPTGSRHCASSGCSKPKLCSAAKCSATKMRATTTAMHPDAKISRKQIEEDLAVETLLRSGSLMFRATGSSMLPEIWPGDVLVVRSERIEDVAAGEIACFRCYGGLVAHRVIERHADSVLIAQGDTTLRPDPPVTDANLLGVVQFVERGGRRFVPRRRPGLASRAIAGLARRSVAMNRVIQRFRPTSGRCSA